MDAQFKSIEIPRRYDSIFDSLSKAELREITRKTSCKKPCKYMKYNMVGERKRTSFKSDNFTFSLWAVSKNTEVKTEALIYPLSSLHYWLRRPIGFWQVQKVGQSRHFLIHETNKTRYSALFGMIMTQILYQIFSGTFLESKYCHIHGQCSKKLEVGLIQSWFFVWWQ